MTLLETPYSDSRLNLFLDDSPERAALAYERMTSKDKDKTIWAKTAEEGISVIRDYYKRLDKISLGHDLGEQGVEMNVASDLSGMEIIRWIEKSPSSAKEFLKKTILVIHTHNLYASKRMYERLKKLDFNVECKPFGE